MRIACIKIVTASVASDTRMAARLADRQAERLSIRSAVFAQTEQFEYRLSQGVTRA